MKDKILLGIRKLAQNRKSANTMRILLPSIYKNIADISFKSKVEVWLINGKNILLVPMTNDEE